MPRIFVLLILCFKFQRPMRIFVNDDRHVMAKHSAVYPTQEELTAVQNMVSHTERALKAVSDWINEQEKGNNEQPEPDTMETVAEEENKEGRFVTIHNLLLGSQLLKIIFSCLRCQFLQFT